MNPSLSLELTRLELNVSNCIQAVLIDKREVDELKKLGYSVLTYRWIFDPITLEPSYRLSVYVCKDREKALKILRKIEELEANPTLENLRKMIELEGKLLGYPRCCVRKFSRLKVERKNPEARIIEECIERGIFEEVLRFYPEPNPDKALSLFTSNFYPCRLDCKKAYEIGKKLVDYNPNYRYKVVLNILNLLVPVFEIYKNFREPKTDFGKLVFSFVESLGDLRLKAESIVNEYAKNPIKFEIDYLKDVRFEKRYA